MRSCCSRSAPWSGRAKIWLIRGEISTAKTVSAVIAQNPTVTITEMGSSTPSPSFAGALVRLRWMNIGTRVDESTPPMTSS